MGIKAIVDDINTVVEAIRPAYKQDGNKYVLDVEELASHPEIGALSRAKEHEKTARQKAEKQAQELAAQMAALQGERDDMLRGVIPRDDVTRLEQSWQKKLSDREKELSDKISSLSTVTQTLLVDQVAHAMAAKLSTVPALLLPHIRSRLSAEIVDGTPATRVLDKAGKLSAMTVADLEKEILTDPMYAPILIGTRSSGSGAAGTSGGGSASISTIDYWRASPREIAAHMKAKKNK